MAVHKGSVYFLHDNKLPIHIVPLGFNGGGKFCKAFKFLHFRQGMEILPDPGQAVVDIKLELGNFGVRHHNGGDKGVEIAGNIRIFLIAALVLRIEDGGHIAVHGDNIHGVLHLFHLLFQAGIAAVEHRIQAFVQGFFQLAVGHLDDAETENQEGQQPHHHIGQKHLLPQLALAQEPPHRLNHCPLPHSETERETSRIIS